MAAIVLILGAGDLASGVALRLFRSGLRIIMTDLPEPLAVRRQVSFAEAIYNGETRVEEVSARRVNDPTDTLRVLQVLSKGQIPVLVDPESVAIQTLHPTVVIDARMLKGTAALIKTPIQLIIGLGPGFTAAQNCHAAIETRRGHTLGRVIWQGSPAPNTGLPDGSIERVLRATRDGIFQAQVQIGNHVEAGQQVAYVDEVPILAPLSGIMRGLVHPGLRVWAGLKIGDIDPRDNPDYCHLVSDKAFAIGGGALEAILSRTGLRPHLWS
jgi:xanthine dehydrogenase accessory factor